MHFDIRIFLRDGHALPMLPAKGLMKVHDTVRYFSEDGPAEVQFTDGSPFTLSTIPGDQTFELIRPGSFFCKCFITPPGAKRVGWSKTEVPQSGGDHDVRP